MNPAPKDSGARPFGTARFLAVFAVMVAAFYAAVVWAPLDRLFFGYLAANARLVNAALRGLGEDTHVRGGEILSPRFSLAVRRGCDGLEPAWLFCSAVVAFPAPIGRKLRVLPVGVATILGANLLRILSLYYIGSRFPAAFALAHLQLWPAAFILLVVGLWLAWVLPLQRIRAAGASF